MPSIPIPRYPFSINIPGNSFNNVGMFSAGLNVTFNSGLLIFLGPNGCGKTTALKALRDRLRTTYGKDTVRFISAGRMGVLEYYRSNIGGDGGSNPNDTVVGSQSQQNHRKHSETVIGDFLTLFARPDVRLKVEARLQGIFKKTVMLSWSQNGLKVDFKSIEAGSAAYGAGNEASGLTQLAALLAALYDDEIKFLLIDEPEVSLHPQLQSFILREIQQVAGDPNVPGKKVVVISTHSPSMLSIKKPNDLISIIFFRDFPNSQVQIDATNSLLTDPHIISLITRLNEIYKIAFFSKSVLLSEGITDEIILRTLIEKYDPNFDSNGGQFITINGKGEFVVADKLFTLIGKKVSLLADLDVLDNDNLVNYVDTKTNTSTLVPGFANLSALYNSANTKLERMIAVHWADISGLVTGQGYWNSTKDITLKYKRSALTFLLTASNAQITGLANSAAWDDVRQLFFRLLDALDSLSFTLIRKGTIEDCFINTAIPAHTPKPIAGSLEAAYLTTATAAQIDAPYTDPLKAIKKIKLAPLVDEPSLLREMIGRVLGTVLANIHPSTTDQDIKNTIEKFDPEISTILKVTRQSVATTNTLKIEILSPLFSIYPSPIEHAVNEPIENLMAKLPS